VPKIHWLGAGLSSVPGIRRLAKQGRDLTLWNRTLEKAQAALGGINGKAVVKKLDWTELSSEANAGDVIVSMLPAEMHMQVAELCLGKQAHFISSSYVGPAMRGISDRAAEAGLCFVNEVGLDPGLDHLLAHALVHDYTRSPQFDKSHQHYFRSYCGGLSKVPNDFRYKFSWSPLGVLKALKSQASWISHGVTRTTDQPWQALGEYTIGLPDGAETFQAYPNRNSLPFKRQYDFGDDWNVQEFVRGTLRLHGWAEAWRDIFALVESAEGAEGDRRLAAKSEELWQKYRLQDDDPDRVVLIVDLEVRNGSHTVWHQRYTLDEVGNHRGSAMGRLVSLPVSLAVEAVFQGKIETGVTPAPKHIDIVNDWLAQMAALGEKFEQVVLV
jgi:saccharopine dehydrogenase (NADP+, L-glutamate forming)